jgi:hypothetical protein
MEFLRGLFCLPYRISNHQPLDQQAETQHFTTRLSGTLGKGNGWTYTCYQLPEAILMKATISTSTQSDGRRVYEYYHL